MVRGGVQAERLRMTTDIRQKIREKAKQEGFDAVGFTSSETDPRDMVAISKFLLKGCHGDMAWMAREFPDRGNPRGNPKALMPDARSVSVLGTNYGPGTDPLEALSRPDRGVISVYARPARDYHDILKERLKRIGRWMTETFPENDVKIFVDTAPVMEKPLGARAGLGWQGKHTNLVSREFGSWLFLGEIFTTLEIQPDKPEAAHCGSCDLCIKTCPTDAIVEPYNLDARRCISYLTIEHKGGIAPKLMSAMGNRIYGCDDCLAVCPWTKFSRSTEDPTLQPRHDLNAPKLQQLAALDDAMFRKLFAGSPIKRTGRDRFVRNVLIAIGNSGDRTLAPTAEALVNDVSSLVSDTARWALGRLAKLDENQEPYDPSAQPTTNAGKGETL